MKRLWHNTFNDILGDGIDQYYQSLTASFTPASTATEPGVVDDLEGIHEGERSGPRRRRTAYDIGLVLAGHGEGRELRKSHKFCSRSNEIATLNHPSRRTASRP